MDTNQITGWRITQHRLADAWRRFRTLSDHARDQGFNVTLSDPTGASYHPKAYAVRMDAQPQSIIFDYGERIDVPCDDKEQDNG